MVVYLLWVHPAVAAWDRWPARGRWPVAAADRRTGFHRDDCASPTAQETCHKVPGEHCVSWSSSDRFQYSPSLSYLKKSFAPGGRSQIHWRHAGSSSTTSSPSPAMLRCHWYSGLPPSGISSASSCPFHSAPG